MILFLDTIPSSNSFCKSALRPRQLLFDFVQEIEIRDFPRRGLFLELTAAARKLHAEEDAFLVYLAIPAVGFPRQIIGCSSGFSVDAIPVLDHVHRAGFVVQSITK